MGHRALPLLVAVAAPALAFGQTAGLLTTDPSEVGQVDCSTAGTTVLDWTINTANTGRSATTSDTYRIALYADGTSCPEPSSAPSSSASNVVVSNLAATGNSQSTTVAYSDMAAAGGVTCPATPPPWTAMSDFSKVLCVYLVASNGVVLGTAAGASGTFLFQLARPPPPVLTSVESGNGALTAHFQAGTATGLDTATSDRYRAEVYLAGVLVTSASGTGTSIRVGGLTNNTTYTVQVIAISPSPASNESAPSTSMTGMPLPFESFWTAYQNAGGREQGGCGGGAGALSLLALLPLALRRRRP